MQSRSPWKCTQTRVQLPLKTLSVDASASQDYDWGEPYHTWSHFWSHIAYLSAVQLSLKLWKTTNARPNSRPKQNQKKTNAQFTCISAGNCFRLPLPYKIVRWNRFFLTSRPTSDCFKSNVPITFVQLWWIHSNQLQQKVCKFTSPYKIVSLRLKLL